MRWHGFATTWPRFLELTAPVVVGGVGVEDLFPPSLGRPIRRSGRGLAEKFTRQAIISSPS